MANVDWNGYQRIVGEIAVYPPTSTVHDRLTYLTLGLNGEAGEVAEKVKRVMRDGTLISPEELASELGDVLWYVAELARLAGIPMEQVVQSNIDKIRRRQAQGTIGGFGDDR